MDRGLRSELGSRLLEFKNYSVAETSYLALRPGNLIEFTYGGQPRYGIVISSKRSSGGIFLSYQYNTLSTVLACDSLDEATFSELLNTMYGNEVAATYSTAKSMPSLKTTGKSYVGNCRTLNVSVLSDIYKVTL